MLTFGESINDARALAELVVAQNTALSGRVRPMARPPSLTRGAGPHAQRQWIVALRGAVLAFEAAQGRVAAVLVHRDADGADPEGSVEADLNRTLRVLPGAVAVVPVQMTEGWWFLFPDAVEAVRPRAWRGVMPRNAVDVENITQPKQHLKELTRRTGHEYAETDSVTIAQQIRSEQPSLLGTSASYSRLQSVARALS